ncbi:hypothetical protein AB0I61_24115 [Polymorphospora rubra]|uniref:hypothetical protein n=1 Tax=Polymorphospora rubra TaxID=338584 RepID=UPI0033F6626C
MIRQTCFHGGSGPGATDRPHAVTAIGSGVAAVAYFREREIAIEASKTLGHRAIEPIAAATGVSVDARRTRLSRIVSRIADALAGRLLTGTTSPETRSQPQAQAVSGHSRFPSSHIELLVAGCFVQSR